MPRFTSQTEEARLQKFNAAVYSIEQQAELYYYKYGVYPKEGAITDTNWNSKLSTYFKGGEIPPNPYIGITDGSKAFELDANGKVTNTTNITAE